MVRKFPYREMASYQRRIGMARKTEIDVTANYDRGWRMGFSNTRAVSCGVAEPIPAGRMEKNFRDGFNAGRRVAASSSAMTFAEYFRQGGVA